MLPILLQSQENWQKIHQHTAATEKQHDQVKPTTLSYACRFEIRDTRADSHQIARSFSEWRSPGWTKHLFFLQRPHMRVWEGMKYKNSVDTQKHVSLLHAHFYLFCLLWL